MEEILNVEEGAHVSVLEEASGASSESTSEIARGPSKRWDDWYPSWDTWKFRRTMTYWISTMYLEGSVLFLTGAWFSLTEYKDIKGMELGLVQTSYFVGGICFTIGSWLGVLEVINIGEDDRFVWLPRGWPEGDNWKALVGYSCYLIGAIFYNVNTIAGYCAPLTTVQDILFNRIPAVMGAAGFLVGSVLECQTNHVLSIKLTSGAWWLSVMNLVGSFGFLVAGTAIIAVPVMSLKVDPWYDVYLVDWPYLVGSAGFLIGGLCTMWLWKLEQYGLGFIPEMNVHVRRGEEHPAQFKLAMNMHAEYGCGRASPYQLPFLVMYIVNATGAVLCCGIAFFGVGKDGGLNKNYEIFEAILNFALSHGVLLLGSVVHHVPTARPHNWLLMYMRVVLAMYTLNSWFKVFNGLSNLSD